MKRVLSAVLAAILLAGVLLSVPLTAGAEAPPDFTVTPFGDSTGVCLWKSDLDGAFYLFLPGGTDTAALTPRFEGEALADGLALADGVPTDALTPGGHTLTLGGTSYQLYVLVSSDMPSVFLTTESGSMDAIHADKEHKETGTITVVENGAVTMEKAALKSIKGRGNSTWGYPKKPYNIKFDKKTDLFGMGKAKKWSFLANWDDDTLMRNTVALDLADRFGLPFTSKRKAVDLYANGEYLGSYLVCESVEVGENRVEIADLASMNEDANPDVEDIEALPQGGTGKNGKPQAGTVKGSMKWTEIPNDPENITGGYLMEVDFRNRYDEEVSGFVTKRGMCVTMKAPEFASENEIRYIAGLWEEMEEALRAADGVNGKGRHYSEYLDVDTFARNYLLEELTMDIDAGTTSFYLYKDADSDRFVAAPVWDFDRALATFDSRYGVQMDDYSGWYANGVSTAAFGLGTNDTESLMTLFFMREENRDAAAAAWNASGIAAASDEIGQSIADGLAALEASFIMDALRWDKGAYAELDDIRDAYAAAGNKMKDFTIGRIATLDRAFAEPVAMLYYRGNGVSGFVFNREIVRVGESVTVLPTFVDSTSKLKPDPNKYRFKCWNTKSDGSGTDYKPGDTITLNARTTKLYAQWHTVVKVAEKPATCSEPGHTAGEQCSKCGKVLSGMKTIPTLPHTPEAVPEKPATCSETGLTAGEKCGVCGEILSGLETIPTLPHTPEAVPGKPATCTEEGLTDGEVCSVCGAVVKAQETIPTLPHTPEAVPGKPATCSEEGLTDGEICSVCGEVLKPQETISALGHTPETVPGTPATCTEEGLTDGEVCSVCGEILKAQETIPALGHTPETIPAKDPTCIETGLTEGEVCSVCGEILKAQEIIPALGHAPETIPAKAPTCTETGLTEGEVCSVCGEILKAQETIPALGHTEPDDDGKCARCGAQIADPKPRGVRGDADLDGKVLAKDARIVLRASAKLETLAGQGFVNCDLDGNGKLTAREARLILRFSAKLEKKI